MEWRWHTRLLLGRGSLALAGGDFEPAGAHAEQALGLAVDTHARKNQARAHLLLGEVALAKGTAEHAHGL